jgi:hypothetical protein
MYQSQLVGGWLLLLRLRLLLAARLVLGSLYVTLMKKALRLMSMLYAVVVSSGGGVGGHAAARNGCDCWWARLLSR